jgi:hypothetical protein
MRRLCLVLAALLLAAGAAPAAWAAGPAGPARGRTTPEERTTLDVKALLGWISEVFVNAFEKAGTDEGPAIDPWGRTTVDEGPHIDPLGRTTADTGPVVDPSGRG